MFPARPELSALYRVIERRESYRFDHWGVLWLSLTLYCDWPR